MKSRLEEKYLTELAPQLKARLGYDNIMRLPRLRKIVLSIGLGEAVQEPKALEAVEKDLTTISGQHPVTTRAKKSISAFKLRAGMPVGMMVTLRGKRMYDFFDKRGGQSCRDSSADFISACYRGHNVLYVNHAVDKRTFNFF